MKEFFSNSDFFCDASMSVFTVYMAVIALVAVAGVFLKMDQQIRNKHGDSYEKKPVIISFVSGIVFPIAIAGSVTSSDDDRKWWIALLLAACAGILAAFSEKWLRMWRR